jgi:phospholipid/cholesterol/gamma-HCH transport system permease protein
VSVEDVTAPPPRRTGRVPGARLVHEAGDIVGFSGRALLATGQAPRYFAETLRQAGILILGTTLVIVAMVTVIGGECGLFAVYLLRSLGGESFLGTTPPLCGLREMWPYMFGYLFAAKVGCGLVAEIGSMRISEELDGIESVGIDPMRYVIATRLLAVWITVPAIYAVAIVFGALGSSLAVLVQFDAVSRGQFESLLLATWTTQDTLYSFVKTMTIATAIAVVGMYYGYRASGGPVGVGNATARSMIVNLVLIHVIGGAYSTIFWAHDYGISIGG